MCLLAAITWVWLDHGSNNIFTQLGLLVMVGLACKNAVLIVEFAKHLQEQRGHDAVTAVLEAAHLRLRSILMTSFAFIMGVVLLMLASGAGAEIRHALGAVVFSGMLGVTIFGLRLTPVFYLLIGRHPDALTGLLSTPLRLPPLPRIIPVGSPEQMLRPRPGIRAAELNLAEIHGHGARGDREPVPESHLHRQHRL